MLGDTAGIGPEIAVKLLSEHDVLEKANIVVFGDKRVFKEAEELTGIHLGVPVVDDMPAEDADESSYPCLLHVEGADPQTIPRSHVSKQAGEAVYETLQLILDIIGKGQLDGFLFAPFNKESMQLGGCPYHSEFLMFMDYFNIKRVHGEVNILDHLWTTRVTSHIPVKDIVLYMGKQRIYETICFLDKEMQKYGIEKPKIAVSALNPHAGENGLFGTEEGEFIQPAVEMAKNEHINVDGPFPCDTIFLRVEKDSYDAVVSMYHDQGQVATKLLGFDRGVTLHGGMSVPVATCAHGTAFDIAWKNIARPAALRAAFDVVYKIACNNIRKSGR